jgi:hypothetical protein
MDGLAHRAGHASTEAAGVPIVWAGPTAALTIVAVRMIDAIAAIAVCLNLSKSNIGLLQFPPASRRLSPGLQGACQVRKMAEKREKWSRYGVDSLPPHAENWEITPTVGLPAGPA